MPPAKPRVAPTPSSTRPRPLARRPTTGDAKLSQSQKVDDLATRLAENLKITGPPKPSGSKKPQATVKETPAEKKQAAMRAVNAANHTLSNLIELGWKPSSAPRKSRSKVKTNDPTSYSLDDVQTVVLSSRNAIGVLRLQEPGRLETERASSSIVAKLVTLELYQSSLEMLAEMKPAILQLYSSSVPEQPEIKRPSKPPPPKSTTAKPSSHFHLLSLPLPDGQCLDEVTLRVIGGFLSQSLFVLAYFVSRDRCDTESFFAALEQPGTLLGWHHLLQSSSLNLRAFQSIVKFFSSSNTDPSTLLDLRIWSLKCLLQTKPLDPDLFWEQCHRFIGSFANATQDGQVRAANVVLKVVTTLTDLARPLDNNIFSGKRFVGFCEYALLFAQKASDLTSLNHISGLINETVVPPPAATYVSRIGIEISVTLSKCIILLERFGTDSEEPELLSHLQQCCNIFSSCSSIFSSSDEASWAKIIRTMERVRRHCMRLLDNEGKDARISSRSDIQAAVKATLIAFVEFAETVCQGRQLEPRALLDLVRSAIDSIFTLSKCTLVVGDFKTYNPAYTFMDRALLLVSPFIETSGSSNTDMVEYANILRCISGGFYNLAATLYKFGKQPAAVRFLIKTCEVAGIALSVLKNIDRRPEVGTSTGTPLNPESPRQLSVDEEQTWKTFKEQLPKRWELLGCCYSNMGERRLLYDSFVQALISYPESTFASLHTLTKGSPVNTIFTSPEYKSIGLLIERITFTAASDLFMKEGSSLRKTLTTASFADEVIGAILEWQIIILEGNYWKDGIAEVVRYLFQDLAEVYGSNYPIRSARVLVRRLEYAYYTQESIEPGETEDQVKNLLSRENFGLDSSLQRYRLQYLSSSHIWLMLHCHSGNRSQPDILRHATAARDILNQLVPIEDSVEGVHSTSPPRGASAKKKVPPAPPSHKRTRSATAKPVPTPITPKRKNRPQVIPAADGGNTTISVIDDLKRFSVQIELAICLLGLLGHLFVKVELLSLLRRLKDEKSSRTNDCYLRSSVNLAHEYVKLGMLGRATRLFNKCPLGANEQDDKNSSTEVRILYTLRYSESLAHSGNLEQSIAMYQEALAYSESFEEEDKTAATSARILARVARLERSAIASSVFAAIQQAKNSPGLAIRGLLQSIRLWHRAIESLSRLIPAPAMSSSPLSSPDPFTETSEAKDGKKQTSARSTPMDGVQWRLTEGLLTTIFALENAYFTRGAARETEFFARQAYDIAMSLSSPAMISRALMRLAELKLHTGSLDDSKNELAQAADLLIDVPTTDIVELHRLRGLLDQRNEELELAAQMYTEAGSILGQLEATFVQVQGPILSPRKSMTTLRESLLPSLLASVLRNQIWLLRDGDYEALLKKLLSLPTSHEIKAETGGLLGQLALYNSLTLFRSDLFLTSLAESTIAVPLGMTKGEAVIPSTTTRQILKVLASAEQHFWSSLELSAGRGCITQVREAALYLAVIRSFQTSLGKSGQHGPTITASLLDIAAATSLRREMMDCAQRKFREAVLVDDLVWPMMDANGSFVSPSIKEVHMRRFKGAFDTQELEPSADAWLKGYWRAIQDRYQAEIFNSAALAVSQVDLLPDNWTVVSIGTTNDKSTLLVSRQRCQHEPLIFSIPLQRPSRRDSDDENQQLTFLDAMNELNDIIKSGNEGARRAGSLRAESKEMKISWWAERAALDQRLKQLLENIEFCWLGAFKAILSEPSKTPPDLLASLRGRFDKVFKRLVVFQDKKQNTRLRLDDNLLECFASISPKCRDEELEDLIYFMLDLYQFHGLHIPLSEVDIDQVAIDLRNALEDHSANVQGRLIVEPDQHLFLVLDKNVQGIPWESIPILRGRSISRIPSISFLIDRLEYTRHQRGLKFEENGPIGVTPPHIPKLHLDRADINPSKVFFILNPSGDLASTEKQFGPWLQKMTKCGWTGITGRQPSEQEYINALRQHDLVIYFGHGGAEQYARGQKIRDLPRCAATMLWGCSSGHLRDMGDFDRLGTPYNYMLAGCPSLIVNLWDVTDRDIDKFSQSVFDKMRLQPPYVRSWQSGKSPDEGSASIIAAVGQSRDVCKLKYLTGAAPVVYGIPFYL